MNWYLQSGKDSDVLINTSIRFSRNLKDFKFNLKSDKEIEKLENKIKENLYQIGYGLKFLKLKDMDEITKQSLVEKELISKEFSKNKEGSILINDEENICIMIGGKEHLEIQVFNSGLELKNTLNLAIEIDNKFGEVYGYAVNKKYGFLTSSPDMVGTGLKAICTMHIPGLVKTNNTRNILDAITNFGITIKKINDEDIKNQSDIYQISNKYTLGISEEEIVENVNIIAEKIIEQERKARRMLASESIGLEDMIFRSYGILANCRKISNEEVLRLLSNVKLGVDLGILDKLNDLKIQKLYLYTKDANLQKYFGEKYEKMELDIKRAEIIKSIINET